MTTDRRETTSSREGEGIMEATHIPTAATVDAAPQHSPTPWTMQDDATFSTLGDKRLMAANGISPGIIFGGLPECAGNQELVLRACNSFDDLLAALKLAQVWLANSVPVADIDGPTPLPVIAAAIAKAEGRLS